MYCRTKDIHLVWEQKRGDLSPSGLRGTPVDKLYHIILLVGGLEHYLVFHDYSQLTFIFFRGVGIPPARWYYIMIFNIVSPIRTQSLTPSLKLAGPAEVTGGGWAKTSHHGGGRELEVAASAGNSPLWWRFRAGKILEVKNEFRYRFQQTRIFSALSQDFFSKPCLITGGMFLELHHESRPLNI